MKKYFLGIGIVVAMVIGITCSESTQDSKHEDALQTQLAQLEASILSDPPLYVEQVITLRYEKFFETFAREVGLRSAIVDDSEKEAVMEQFHEAMFPFFKENVFDIGVLSSQELAVLQSYSGMIQQSPDYVQGITQVYLANMGSLDVSASEKKNISDILYWVRDLAAFPDWYMQKTNDSGTVHLRCDFISDGISCWGECFNEKFGKELGNMMMDAIAKENCSRGTYNGIKAVCCECCNKCAFSPFMYIN
jgi:hypothetical protein